MAVLRSMLILAVLAVGMCVQLTAQFDNTSFPALLTGGSKGVPNHLHGDLRVRNGAVEFAAYPQIYNVSWSCGDLQRAGTLTRKKRIIELSGKIDVHRFELASTDAATEFEAAAIATCK